MPGWNIVRIASVTSTMDEIDALAEAGAPDRTVVVAEEQTAGRGRAGRQWTAPAGSGLFLSILYRPALEPALLGPLPLIVGSAVADAIEIAFGIDCRLKWPNDILGSSGKLGGILVTSKLAEGRLRFVSIGVGINCTATKGDLPPGGASILSEFGKRIAPSDVLPVLLDQVDRRLAEFERAHGRPELDNWLARAAFLGEVVAIIDQGRRREGRFVGVDADGALLLENADGVRVRIVSGDLTRGPRLLNDL
mgnify:CR=1 FL=1